MIRVHIQHIQKNGSSLKIHSRIENWIRGAFLWIYLLLLWMKMLMATEMKRNSNAHLLFEFLQCLVQLTGIIASCRSIKYETVSFTIENIAMIYGLASFLFRRLTTSAFASLNIHKISYIEKYMYKNNKYTYCISLIFGIWKLQFFSIYFGKNFAEIFCSRVCVRQKGKNWSFQIPKNLG